MHSDISAGDDSSSVEERYATVRQLAVGALARQGITVHAGPGDAPGDELLIGNDGYQYRLYNLQLQCAQLAPFEWAHAVEVHFEQGRQGRDTPRAETLTDGEFLAQVRTRLNPRMPAEQLPMAYARPAFGGLVAELNRDLPTAVTAVSDYDVAGRDLDLLYETGQRNTDAEPMSIERLDEDVVAVLGESFFIASKALNMPGLIKSVLGGSAPLGVVFSVPHRSLLLLHAVGPKVMGALSFIVPATVGQADQAPGGALSRDTYYWHGGAVQRITQRDPATNSIGVLVEGAFADAVDRVAAG